MFPHRRHCTLGFVQLHRLEIPLHLVISHLLCEFFKFILKKKSRILKCYELNLEQSLRSSRKFSGIVFVTGNLTRHALMVFVKFNRVRRRTNALSLNNRSCSYHDILELNIGHSCPKFRVTDIHKVYNFQAKARQTHSCPYIRYDIRMCLRILSHLKNTMDKMILEKKGISTQCS